MAPGVADRGELGAVELREPVDGRGEQLGPRVLEVVPGGVVGGIAEAEVRPEVDDRLALVEELSACASPPSRGAARGTRPRSSGTSSCTVSPVVTRSGGSPRSGRRGARVRRGRRSRRSGGGEEPDSSAPTYPVAPTIATRIRRGPRPGSARRSGGGGQSGDPSRSAPGIEPRAHGRVTGADARGLLGGGSEGLAGIEGIAVMVGRLYSRRATA